MDQYYEVPFENVTFEGGFWQVRQEINRHVTVQAVYDRFSDTKRFDALRCERREDQESVAHIFWDSDVAKWLEGAAYLLAKEPSAELESLCDQAIADILESQEESGYFNSHYLVTEQEDRFKIRNNHELYCAGHLFEAACAYYEATGKRAFLDGMCRYADYIYDVFYSKKSAAFVVCGHPEVELALVRLAKTTKNPKYMELARYFVEQRGNNDKDESIAEWVEKSNDQSHKPLKEQTTAEGHSVRACYIYSALADIAREYEDAAAFAACDAIFDNIIHKRMYITGGIGSTNLGEAFTIDYDLPNATSYAETCAAISLAFFAQRMLKIKPDAKYADAVERVIYNGALSGVSLDGKRFFYTNPLEIDPYFSEVNSSTKAKRYVPITQRVEVFECSCCPPNIVRFVASMGRYLYTRSADTVFVHQYAPSKATMDGVTITQTTAYPADGEVDIHVEGALKTLAVRIPGWCEVFTCSEYYFCKDGYAYIAVPTDGKIRLSFAMPVQLIQSHPQVQENAERVAVMRGPIVYCLEGVDNGSHLRSLSLVYDNDFETVADDAYGVPVLRTMGERRVYGDGLYSRFTNRTEPTPLTLIPYFAFANRGETEMTVWIHVKG